MYFRWIHFVNIIIDDHDFLYNLNITFRLTVLTNAKPFKLLDSCITSLLQDVRRNLSLIDLMHGIINNLMCFFTRRHVMHDVRI